MTITDEEFMRAAQSLILGLSSSVVDYLFYFDTNEKALDTLRAMIKYAEAHEDSL